MFWAVLAAMGVALLAPTLSGVETSTQSAERPSPADATTPPVATEAAAAALGNGLASAELKRSPDGHFYADAQVNGARIRFMVDTGASIVALTPDDARRAGIPLGSERETVRGVGGEVEVIPVTIDRIAIGPLAARRVTGAVAEDLPVSLLGQSFLSRADAVEIRGDRMVLR